MHVVLGMVRHVVVEDVTHRRNIESAGRHVARHEHGRLAGPEAFQSRHPRALVHVPMQGRRVEAVPLQGPVQHRDVPLAIAEDDRVSEVLRSPYEVPQGLALFVRLATRRDEALAGRRDRRGGPRHLHPHGVVEESVGEPVDFRRHGRGEEKRLARERYELDDPLDVRDEAHVEHSVGLVDDEEFDARQQELAALEMIEQPARRADEHVDAARDLGILVAERDAADQERDRQSMIDAVLVEALFHLRREFARRLEDERAGHAGPGATAFELCEHGKHERSRLARSGLRDAENVAASEHVRNGLSLNRRRLGVTGRRDSLLNFLA
jgi:hypothetical protein